MTTKNKYANRSKISEKKTKISDLNRNTINRYLAEIRRRIFQYYQLQLPFSGAVEIDESCFGACRIKGKRGRGAQSKTIVFGNL